MSMVNNKRQSLKQGTEMPKSIIIPGNEVSHSIQQTEIQSTVGLYLLNRLHELGVKDIFGVPGDYILRFNKMIEEHPIHFINTTRENTAGYMADAYARLRGLGAACITYGVGINIANALAQAFVESSPLVVISGASGTDEYLKSNHLHHLINNSRTNLDSTQLEIFKQVTIAQAVIDDPETAQTKIDHVLHMCLKHKKPVYIELPRNAVAAPLVVRPRKEFPPDKADPKQLEEAFDEIAAMMKQSKKPLIWAGHEIQRFELCLHLLKFAEKYNIPIVSSLLGKTVVSERHPLFVGVYQGGISRPEVSAFVEKCDCVFILGTILSDVETGIFSAKEKANSIFVNTEEGVRIRHHHFHKIPLPVFMNQLSKIDIKVKYPTDHPANIKRQIPKFNPYAHKKITTERMFDCIQQHLTSEHIVVTDIGDALFGSEDLILEHNSFLASAYFETLGFGAPGAIGAQLAEPDRRVVSIVGDGGFQMTAMELSTAVRYKLDPVIIVMNNHGYGTERPLLEGTYNDIQDWNYAKIPEVVNGGIGIEVKTESEFEKALITALKNRGQFYLIEVELEKTDFSPAMRRFSALVKKTVAKQS